MPVVETVTVPSPTGTVFVPDGGTAQILQITPSGTQSPAVTRVKSIQGLAVDPDGNVFYTDLEEDHVVRATGNITIADTFRPVVISHLNQPTGSLTLSGNHGGVDVAVAPTQH